MQGHRTKKNRPDLVMLNLDYSRAGILQLLQEARGLKPSLPLFIYSTWGTKRFGDQDAKIGASVIFSKTEAQQILDEITKQSLGNKDKESWLDIELAAPHITN